MDRKVDDDEDFFILVPVEYPKTQLVNVAVCQDTKKLAFETDRKEKLLGRKIIFDRAREAMTIILKCSTPDCHFDAELKVAPKFVMPLALEVKKKTKLEGCQRARVISTYDPTIEIIIDHSCGETTLEHPLSAHTSVCTEPKYRFPTLPELSEQPISPIKLRVYAKKTQVNLTEI